MFAMCKCRKPRKPDDEIISDSTDLTNHDEFISHTDADNDDEGDYTDELEPGESLMRSESPSTRRPDTPKSIASEHEFIDLDEAHGEIPAAEDLDKQGACVEVGNHLPTRACLGELDVCQQNTRIA